MNIKSKRVLLLILLIFLGIIVICSYDKQSDTLFEKKEEIKNESNKVPGMVSLMIETEVGSEIYEPSTSTTWPGKNYKFNSEKSGCENNGTLYYDEDTQKVVLKTNISDKCYAYFNIVPPDVTVNTTNRPSTVTESKVGSVDCSGGNATYNQLYNSIEISSINKYTICTLNYTDTSKVNLASYIIGLSGTTQGTGQVVNENGYRYEGKNPNNYIWFNNEYWRIIGVFDSASHGQSGKNLVKIIREGVIDGIVWDTSSSSDWSKASLNSLLNEAYYNAEDGTNSGYCYGNSTTSLANCNYTKRGIQADYRGMIANVTWYLGGYSKTGVTTAAFYGYERGTTVNSGNATSSTGYIGLMYPSDFGYAVLSSSCARTTNLDSYDTAACSGQNWLYGKGYEWTITPSSSYSSFVHHLYSFGYLDTNISSQGYGSRPVLYLDASVYKVAGDGTISSPYIVGM